MSKTAFQAAAPCALAFLALLLTGCGTGVMETSLPEAGTASVSGFHGSVHGGQPPVSGAHVYLYESVVADIYGRAAHSLLGPAANTTSDGTNYYTTTDAGGSFSLTGNYACTSGAQVYVLALGGNAGGGVNSGIGLMAGLGQCPSARTLLAQVPFVIINEVTTVAAAYGLAGFMLTPTQLSIRNTQLGVTALANAMANTLNIVNIGTGLAPSGTLAAGSSGVVPQAKIYTLANILASCVNSSGPASTPCSMLFATATGDGTAGGTQPGNTAQAILNIAHFPGSNVTALYNLSPSTPVFAPTLSSAPNDWLLPVTFSNPIAAAQNGLAIDAAGNAWVAGGNLVGKISPVGVASPVYTGLPNTTYTHSSLSIDANGNAWVSDYAGNTVSILNATGLQTTSAIGAGGLNGPAGIAFDGSGKAFVENYLGNSVSVLTSSAAAYSTTPVASNKAAYQIAVDSTGGAWASSYDTTIKHLLPGASTETAVTALSGYNQAVAIAGTNTVWVGGDNGGSGAMVYLGANNGFVGVLQYGPFIGGGVSTFNEVAQIAIDGNGQAWAIGATANFGYVYSNFVALQTGGSPASPSTGYQNVPNVGNLAIAIDGSGDVWVTNANRQTTEFLGAAYPTATPILPNQLGALP